MEGGGIKVKRVDEVSEEDLSEFTPELRRDWEAKGYRWVVIDGRLLCGAFKTREEAEREASLLKRAKEALSEVEEAVKRRLSQLPPEELSYLYEYTGGRIVVGVPKPRRPGIRTYEVMICFFGKPAEEIDWLEDAEIDSVEKAEELARRLEELGGELRERLREDGRIIVELVRRGWTGQGLLYGVSLMKEATWEEVERDAREVGLDPDNINEIPEEEEY